MEDGEQSNLSKHYFVLTHCHTVSKLPYLPPSRNSDPLAAEVQILLPMLTPIQLNLVPPGSYSKYVYLFHFVPWDACSIIYKLLFIINLFLSYFPHNLAIIKVWYPSFPSTLLYWLYFLSSLAPVTEH